MKITVALVALLFAAAPVSAGPQSILVKFRSPSAAYSARRLVDAELVERFSAIDVEHWRVEGSQLEACEQLRRNPSVLYANPDHLVFVDAIPTDSLFPLQWHHENTMQSGGCFDCDLDTPEAWDLFTGDSTLIVGVIDTGLQITPEVFGIHPDLIGNIWTNDGEIPDNGIDDDGNGFIDDVNGWDFGGDGITQDNMPHDNNGHGTHVSGIIGARGNNDGRGVAGINWRIKIMPIKFTIGIEPFGYISSAVGALDYARMMGAKFTNNSYIATINDPTLEAAVAACTAAGMLTVCAAGNNGTDMDCCPGYCTAFPAGYPDPGVIAVGASTEGDGVSTFSNTGAMSVDLFAPGQSVLSTYKQSRYIAMSGTSMAAPCVTGALALLKGYAPSLTAEELKARVLSTVDVKPAFSGRCLSGGRLNVHSLLLSAPTVGVGPPAITHVIRPASNREYDVQGRRVEHGARSGITFRDSSRTVTKRATVK